MPATCVRCVADFADCLPRSLEAPLRDPLLRDWGTPRGGARTPVRTHAQRFGHLHTGCKSGGGMAAGGGPATTLTHTRLDTRIAVARSAISVLSYCLRVVREA